jgi:hypothetical protein
VTTVTFTGGTDYTLANATISDPFYSYATNPQGYPTYFNYTPTWGGFSTAPALGGGMCRFSVVGGVCFYMAHFNTSGTSNATSLTASIPVTNASIGQYPVTRIQDNGTYSFGMCEVTSVLTFFKDASSTGFTASGSKNAWWGVSYII